MELGLNLSRPDDCPPVPAIDLHPGTPPPTQPAIAEEMAVGRFVLQLGEPRAAALREFSEAYAEIATKRAI